MRDQRLTAELSRGTGPEGADEVLLDVGGERHTVSVGEAAELAYRIKVAIGRTVIACNYCGGIAAAIPTESTWDSIVAAVNEHERECPANPHRARIAELEAELAIARAEIERWKKQLRDLESGWSKHNAEIAKRDAEIKRLRGLFAIRKASDEKTILDDIAISAGLLRSMCGEIGFGLSRRLTSFVKTANAALATGEATTA